MSNVGRFSKLVAAAAVAGIFSVGSAAAATCSSAQSGATSSSGLDTSNVTVTWIGGSNVATVEATSCAGLYSGNDTGAQGTLLGNLNNGMFGGDLASGWSLYGKSDDNPSIVYADQDEKTGSWSVDFSPWMYSVFSVTLKGGTGYATYLFDFRPLESWDFGGGFDMAGVINKGGQIAELSHLTIATWGTPTPIPLPATGWLMLSVLGLGGLVAHRKRKQKMAA